MQDPSYKGYPLHKHTHTYLSNCSDRVVFSSTGFSLIKGQHPVELVRCDRANDGEREEKGRLFFYKWIVDKT